MTIHIISDNPLFLRGIIEQVATTPPSAEYPPIKTHDINFAQHEIARNAGIIIFIYNEATRMAILSRLALISSHIVIMVDSEFEHDMAASYPLRICSRSTLHEILAVSSKIRCYPSPGKVSDNTYAIFKALYSGTSTQAAVEIFNLNLFNLYNLKKRVFTRFGLANINDKGILHCMAYLKINRLVSNAHHNTQYPV
ncbi:hypothetical protein M2417_000501 [Raoultella terrigena]|nr:hypothetical protein [Raoultella terrigena]